MEATHEGAETPLDPDDVGRGTLPSDDEDGPEDPDEEEDAMAPGDHIAEEAAAAAAGMHDEPAAGAAAAETPAAPPLLPEVLKNLVKPELMEQLVWRGVKYSSNDKKAELITKLEQSIANKDALLKPEDEGFEAVRQLPRCRPTRMRAADVQQQSSGGSSSSSSSSGGNRSRKRRTRRPMSASTGRCTRSAAAAAAGGCLVPCVRKPRAVPCGQRARAAAT